MDPRYLTLAENLVSHSTNLTAGEKILIHAFDVPDAMVLALVRAARARRAIPFVQVQHARLDRECILGGEDIQFEDALTWELHESNGRIRCLARFVQCLSRIRTCLQRT